jgi:ABC-type amino acid transport system permease subunit
MARSLFGDICPEKFNNLVKTFFSLFTLLTLDDWYSVYQVCAERDYSSFQLIFCLIYIFIINFILLNLLMAVLGIELDIYFFFFLSMKFRFFSG